ncbi:DNA repair protein RadA [Euphorbia peplus]|nr:DNA repair protein RadA [Euphorbia peplus]
MKAIRLLCTQKHLFVSQRSKTPKVFFLHPRKFRSSSLCFSGESGDTQNDQFTGNARSGWSIYLPDSSKIVTERSLKKTDDQESVSLPLPSILNGDSGRERTHESAPKGNLSSSNTEINNSFKESGNSGGLKGDNVGDREKSKLGLSRYSNDNDDSRNGRRYGGPKRTDVAKDVMINRKKVKSKIVYVCNSCGYTDGQWWGYCRECKTAGAMKQFSERDTGNGSNVSGSQISENMVRSWLPSKAGDAQPVRLIDVNKSMNQLAWRFSLPGLFGEEVCRVLGGGIVPGSLILVGGDPGVGKSTLLLQIAALIVEGKDVDKRAPVVYVSGEESVEQIVNRADRLCIGAEELFLYPSTDVEDILAKVQLLSPCALIVDSIQTAYIQGVTGSAGGLSQVKECTSALLRYAKKTNIPVILSGHVNKSGDIAGPRVLEHIVDVVLYLEGEKHSTHRLLRPVKNRFGSTDELGVFEMSQSGLQAVANPSEIFLSEQYTGSEILVGLAVAVVMDGSRSFLIEIQALCTTGSSVSRQVNGIQAGRADMIISVVKKQAGLMLQENAIFLNVVSGITLTETAGDVAVAAAICSSFLEMPIPKDVAFIGEIGLGGELRTVPLMEKRVNTVAKIGYKMCIVPKSAEKYLSNLASEEIKIIGCVNLREMIDAVFTGRK